MTDNEIVEEQLKYWKSYISGAGFEAHNAWLAIQDVLAIKENSKWVGIDDVNNARLIGENLMLNLIRSTITNRLGGNNG